MMFLSHYPTVVASLGPSHVTYVLSPDRNSSDDCYVSRNLLMQPPIQANSYYKVLEYKASTTFPGWLRIP